MEKGANVQKLNELRTKMLDLAHAQADLALKEVGMRGGDARADRALELYRMLIEDHHTPGAPPWS